MLGDLFIRGLLIYFLNVKRNRFNDKSNKKDVLIKGGGSTNYFPRLYLYLIGRFSSQLFSRGKEINSILMKSIIFMLKTAELFDKHSTRIF